MSASGSRTLVTSFRVGLGRDYMSEPAISLVPVRMGDIAIGKPLPRAIYDGQGNLLLASGCVIESRSQLDGLIHHGFIKDYGWEQGAPPARPKEGLLVKAARKPVDTPPPEDANGSKEVVVAMDDVRWHVGETLYLQQVDNTSTRYSVQLIGFVKNKSIFVTSPAVDGKLEFVRDGQTFVVRAFSGKKAYAFVAAALKSVHVPHPYLHLSYPKELRCTVVRRGVRVQVKLAAVLSLGQPARDAELILTDISVGGASAVSKQVLGNKGEEGLIRLKVCAADQDETLTLKVALRSVTPAESGEGYRHGIEFLDVASHDSLILSAFVHQTLAEGL